MGKPQRMTDGYHGDLAVFLIGMRINSWWRPDLWLPTIVAMVPMLTELFVARAAAERGEGPDLGFLGARTLLGSRGPTVVQYWRSTDDIYRYAFDTDANHRPAWQAFNARARRSSGSVGIWHETYAVPAGGHETVYVDTPPLGLAAATSTVPVAQRGDRARERLGDLAKRSR